MKSQTQHIDPLLDNWKTNWETSYLSATTDTPSKLRIAGESPKTNRLFNVTPGLEYELSYTQSENASVNLFIEESENGTTWQNVVSSSSSNGLQTVSFTPNASFLRVSFESTNSFQLHEISLNGELFDTLIVMKAFGGTGYRYGFNSMERDDEVKGQGNSYDFGARMYDPRVGRWLSVDPKAALLPSYSPYAYALNNPIIMIDPDGQYPIYFITRSYAPFKTFGPGYNWYGDDRGHTLDKGASYRTLASINYDTETYQTSAFGGRSRSHTVDGRKSAYSDTYISNRSKGNNIDVHSYGNNAAQKGSWDIDQFTKLTVNIEGNVKKDHILSITGTISGDDFPNQESMVYDAKGNTLWLGNFETTGDREYGPVTDLPLENEGDVNININVRIKVNSDGVFQGVMQTGKDGKETMISIDDWNKKFE
ncbi:MAG TPA: RHS repeat-associated core domain-containing protein [Brumimicrobium sp.]|nr:RHS repeat-associated core domain-containing protein [Brumimicrobium sp.]